MFRREFLKHLGLAVPGLLSLSTNVSANEYYHPILGKYISHSIHAETIETTYVDGKKYYHFPFARTLVVKYEKGAQAWVNFNCSIDLVNRIKQMGPYELFNGLCDDKLLIFDGISLYKELYQGKKIKTGAYAKFFLEKPSERSL